MKPGGPLRHRSVKRAREERRYSVLRKAYLEGHPLCQFCDEAPATEVHHRAGRVGALLTAVDNFAAVCRSCHQWITEHPREAIRLGISEPRIGRAET